MCDYLSIPKLDLYPDMHRTVISQSLWEEAYWKTYESTCMNEFMNMSVSFYQNIEVFPCDFSFWLRSLLPCKEEVRAVMLRPQIWIFVVLAAAPGNVDLWGTNSVFSLVFKLGNMLYFLNAGLHCNLGQTVSLYELLQRVCIVFNGYFLNLLPCILCTVLVRNLHFLLLLI
jgi:hypothetical protein